MASEELAPAGDNLLPEGQVTVGLTHDTELVIVGMLDGTSGRVNQIDVRLHRRQRSALAGGGFFPTNAGFRVRLSRLPDVIAALQRFAQRAR